MKGLFLNQQFSYESQLEEPKPKPDECLLAIRYAGICNTDIELSKGYKGGFIGIAGHEFVAEVIDGDPAWIGKRVVGDINVSDHSCPTCLAGMPTHCENRKTVGIIDHNGAFAERMSLVTRNLHEVPEGVTDVEACFTEPLAAALEILEQVHIKPTDRVLLIGAGKLGLLIAQVLKLTGCDLKVVIRRSKQAHLLSKWGIAYGELSDFDKQKFDLVVDCTGNQAGLETAMERVRPRGTIVLKSTYATNANIAFSKIVVDEIKMIGSRCGPFEPALRLLKEKRVDVQSLVDGIYPIEDGLKAFQKATEPGALKILLEI